MFANLEKYSAKIRPAMVPVLKILRGEPTQLVFTYVMVNNIGNEDIMVVWICTSCRVHIATVQ